MVEEIIGFIKGVTLHDWATFAYNLVFTDRRLIGDVVHIGLSDVLLFGAGGAEANIWLKSKEARNSIIEGTPDEILSKKEDNFSIYYSDIDSIKLKRKSLKLKLNSKVENVGKKAMFTFSKKQHDDVERLLTKLLSDKVLIK